MAGQEDDAPWLAEAAPQRAPSLAQKRPMLNIAIGVLALAAVVAVALLMLLGRKDGGTSEGYMEAAQAPLIEADPGPYKEPPADREGMEVEGDGEVIHEAVRGGDVAAQIDMNALPEEPMGRPRDLLPPAAAPAVPPPATGQAVPVQVIPANPAPLAPPKPISKPAPKPTGSPAATPMARAASGLTPPASSGTPRVTTAVQIGAFSSEAKAQEEWARVAGKGGLTGKRVEKISTSAGKTLWRVRGLAADPAAACKAIAAANGACEAVKP